MNPFFLPSDPFPPGSLLTHSSTFTFSLPSSILHPASYMLTCPAMWWQAMGATVPVPVALDFPIGVPRDTQVEILFGSALPLLACPAPMMLTSQSKFGSVNVTATLALDHP